MKTIALLLCMLLALVGHLWRRLQSSFATIGRGLFIALACLVLVACGGSGASEPSEEELAEEAAYVEGVRERMKEEMVTIKTLISEGEYCEVFVITSRWLGYYWDPSKFSPIKAELQALQKVAENGCLSNEGESKTWACAEGHSCR